MTRLAVSVPEPTLKRLPLYYHYFKRLLADGRDVVSCTHIGNDLDFDPPQIRKDLAYTGIRGVPKVGYTLPELLDRIERFFGWNRVDEGFLVGVGNLGRALLGYKGFENYGFNIVAAFDSDPAKVHTTVSGIKVLDMSKLSDLAKRMKVSVGLIATPDVQAQGVADVMISGGIAAIWNFAPICLKTPDHIIVQNENLGVGLAVLTKKLQLQSETITQEVL